MRDSQFLAGFASSAHMQAKRQPSLGVSQQRLHAGEASAEPEPGGAQGEVQRDLLVVIKDQLRPERVVL